MDFCWCFCSTAGRYSPGAPFWACPYGSLLSLELRGLCKPDASAFMDRNAVFPYLLHFAESPPGSRSHECRPDVPRQVCPGAVRRRSGGMPLSCPGLPGGSSRILRQVLSVVRLAESYISGSADPAAAPGIRLGSGWLLGRARALAAVCLDAGSFSLEAPSSAGGLWPLERRFLHRIPADP